MQLSEQLQVFLFPPEPREPDSSKEMKRTVKKEQELTCFAFPVATKVVFPRNLLPRSSASCQLASRRDCPATPAAGGTERRGGGTRGIWIRSLKAQPEKQKRFTLKSWFVSSLGVGFKHFFSPPPAACVGNSSRDAPALASPQPGEKFLQFSTTPVHFRSLPPAGQKAKLLPEVLVIHASCTEFTPLTRTCQPPSQ